MAYDVPNSLWLIFSRTRQHTSKDVNNESSLKNHSISPGSPIDKRKQLLKTISFQSQGHVNSELNHKDGKSKRPTLSILKIPRPNINNDAIISHEAKPCKFSITEKR